MLTPRENYIRFLKKEPYDWIPNGNDQRPFFPALIPENIARGFVLEQTPFPAEKLGGPDWFGVQWVFDPVIMGSMETAPLMQDVYDLENWEKLVVFPDLDQLDWEGCAKQNSAYLKTDQLLVSAIFTGYFERLISFVGFQGAAIALIDEDLCDAVHGLFAALTEFYAEIIRRMHRHFGVEMMIVHDDWGTQRSLMFSVETHREMILPHIKTLYAAAHEEGVFIEQHSCGKIEKLLPNLIESGADVWRGQPDANDKDLLIDCYGDRFAIGLEGNPGYAMTDEALVDYVGGLVERHRGKRIWFSFLPGTPPGQRQLISAFLKEQKV